MRSSICWIEHPKGHRLGIMARPRSGDWLGDEISAWKLDGVAAIVCLLEPEEIDELGLADEADLCRSEGIEFISFPIADRGVPNPHEAKDVASALSELGQAGKAVAIHCRAGIGRSALMAGAVLTLSGVEPLQAMAAIERARGVKVPDTEAQLDWLIAFHTPS